jgi:hypothetical protein
MITKRQLKRQDKVDDEIYNLLTHLCPKRVNTGDKSEKPSWTNDDVNVVRGAIWQVMESWQYARKDFYPRGGVSE